ncbi:hypothetical protein D3C85_1739170 [compost metagenome]
MVGKGRFAGIAIDADPGLSFLYDPGEKFAVFTNGFGAARRVGVGLAGKISAAQARLPIQHQDCEQPVADAFRQRVGQPVQARFRLRCAGQGARHGA